MAGKYPGPPERLALYEALVALHPDVDRKGAKNPYTSRNGHMFSFLDATGSMGLRLSPERREAFIAQYGTRLAEQYGAVMKEYAVVPDDLLERTGELAAWFSETYVWIGTLKPKPTTRPKKKKSP